jgi:hypothetical protein
MIQKGSVQIMCNKLHIGGMDFYVNFLCLIAQKRYDIKYGLGLRNEGRTLAARPSLKKKQMLWDVYGNLRAVNQTPRDGGNGERICSGLGIGCRGGTTASTAAAAAR